MQSLIIKDLSRAEELDADAMSVVRGGSCGSSWKMPSCFPSPVHAMPSPVVSTTSVSISQANNQCQSNATGNGSAVFGGAIYANNNQQGFNSVGGYAPSLPFVY